MNGLFLAPKIKYCVFIDENGIISPKTSFKRYDQKLVGLNFKDFSHLQRGDTILGNSQLKSKRGLCGVNIPHSVFQCPQSYSDKIEKQCEMSPKLNGSECEVVKACKNCLNKIIQTKYYSTEIKQFKRLSENEIGYMLPHFSCFFFQTFLHIIHLL